MGDALRADSHLLQTYQERRERQAAVLRVLRHGLRDCDQGYRSEGQRGLDVSGIRQCGGETTDLG